MGKDPFLRRCAVVLGVVCGLVYANSIQGDFHFDDGHSIRDNLAIRSVSNLPRLWTDMATSSFTPDNRVYRPVVYMGYMLCWYLGGGAVWPFHLAKILMHWGVCVALFLMCRRLWAIPGWFPLGSKLKIQIPFTRRAVPLTRDVLAAMVALIFAVHPANTEIVDYISTTTSLQAAFFYLWSFLAYLWFRDDSSNRKAGLFISILLYFLSTFTKEEGVTLPAVIVLTELFLLKEKKLSQRVLQSLKRASPFIVIGLFMAIVILKVQAAPVQASRNVVYPWQYFLTQLRGYLLYLKLLFWPWDLNADYAIVRWSYTFDSNALQATLGNLILIVTAWWSRKKFPAYLYGLAWYYITIAPASSFIPLAEAYNEHRMYLSYVGFIGAPILLLIWMAEKLLKDPLRSKRIGMIYSMIVLGLAFGTIQRNQVWADDGELWKDTVEKNPGSGRAHNNLGLYYMRFSQFEKAIAQYDECLRYWPMYWNCHLNKGIALTRLDQIKQAEASYQQAMRLRPGNIYIVYQYGEFLATHKGRCQEAVPLLKKADELSARQHLRARNLLAQCYQKMGKAKEAESLFLESFSLNPKDITSLFGLAQMQFSQGKVKDSVETYSRVLQVDRSALGAWYNRGVSKLALKDYRGAVNDFEKTVELDPKSERGWYNLSYAYDVLEQGNEALRASKRLLDLRPRNSEFKMRHETLLKKYRR